ncbi:MAG TPA: SDR family NAD(P)-dependent oxidoreductase [Hypericibacter adhaerens]|jgi:NAD(P)-dependent dehydrogenase (short-subunit alcohol dehydrogenase family)|uniref:3-hydroxyacyl-CoA dehydrogenase n=1 Tax=Hypericibacter adhaerens TaxID=2602016 RepID=A0A5J6MW08_9PROT|nr:SDR family NAD(P)-dependent oxidoreductase [Hypericibacter adhaerens]QEX20350.1 3-hydroxyacyl-CoA dehydrogenase [Hypericibacter adhaerens]HWA46596.1 SDR family NAD(P)-dependent oxidoreductase [Hypericibacter adhaerens]
MNVKDKIALVTGAASGLGLATARKLVSAGAKVLCLDLGEDRLRAAVADLGNKALAHATDVADEEAVREAVALAVRHFGTVHIAVNCAGVVDAARTISKGKTFPTATWDKVVGINLTGSYNVIKHAALAMERNEPDAEGGERGVIVNTASGAAWQGQVGQAAYSASKAGVMGLTLPVARDLATVGIRVVSIAPGMFDTAMASGLPPNILSGIVDKMILFPNRLGRPDEFAGLVLHIAENAYLNATTITIDGGARISTR